MSCIYLHCLLPQVLSGVPGNHEPGPFDLLLELHEFPLLSVLRVTLLNYLESFDDFNASMLLYLTLV